MKEEYTTKSEGETIKLGEEFAKKLNASDVVFLTGDLGSGKTTFTKGVARGLGVTTRIISPTFVLLRTHKTNNKFSQIQKIYHMDLYRLNSEEELKGVDLQDFLQDPQGLMLVEWPNLSQNLVKKNVWKVNFKIYYGDNRKITIKYE